MSHREREPSAEEWLRTAGPRPKPPEPARAEARLAVEEAWRHKLDADRSESSAPAADSTTEFTAEPAIEEDPPRRAWRTFSVAAIAALLALTFVGERLWTTAPAVPVAILEVWLPAAETSSGQDIMAGEEIVTHPGQRAALRLSDGTSIRLDQDSRLTLHAIDRLELLAGAVYIDSPDESASLTVHTPFGSASDLGTQFEVRLDEEVLRVQVREGAVRLDTGGKVHEASAGTRLDVLDGKVRRSSVASYGEPWEWALLASPPYELENRSLREVLDWVVRETGWTLHYGDPALQEQVEETIIRGALGDLAPDEVPDVVLAGAGLDFQLNDGVLTIRALPHHGSKTTN